jgi:hypothetical protein
MSFLKCKSFKVALSLKSCRKRFAAMSLCGVSGHKTVKQH